MKPEELFEKLINNEISREEFEALLEGFDSDEIGAKYDAYLAALAIESGCEWITTDRDYARFPQLSSRHPLSE